MHLLLRFARGSKEHTDETREQAELRTTPKSNNESRHKDVRSCRGPAPVDPGWFEGGGTASASLEKYIFNHRYIERLETDSVVGRLVEKRGWITWIMWNSIHAPDGNSARKTRSKKEQHGGISLSGNWSHFFILGFAYIPFVTYRDEYRVTWGSAVLTFIKIRCFT